MLIHPFKPSQLVLSLSPMLFSLTKMKFPPTWLWISHDYNRPKCIEPGNRPHPKSLTLITYITYFEAFRVNCDSYECWLWQSCRHWILMLFVIINFTASLFPNYLVCFSLPFLDIYWKDFLRGIIHGSGYWTEVWSYPSLVKPLPTTLSYFLLEKRLCDLRTCKTLGEVA